MSPATVAHWIDQGHLRGHRTPTGRRRVTTGDLLDFLRSHGMAVPSELTPVGGGDMVVVVEDDEAYRRVLVRSLAAADLGVEVLAVGTGMDALLEVGRVRPALIVLDFHLPDLNALQIVQRLLEPGRRLAAEVIVVSSGVPGDAQDELRRLGVRTIVGKLDGMPVVVEAVRQALGRRKVA